MTLDGLICNVPGMILALTPSERWQAARTPSQGLLTNHWFVLVCIVLMVALTGLLCWVSLRRRYHEHQQSDRVFIEMAGEKSLTVRECQILKTVAKCSGRHRQESVFSDRSAFERGAAKMIEKTLSGRGSQEKQQLITEVSLLREKIGFGKDYAALGATQLKSLSSRQIPVAKQVTLFPMPGGEARAIEAIIHDNKPDELSVRFDEAIKVTFGGLWTVRYSSGASVWEFDTSVLSYDGTLLMLTHSDHVRFVNRRRFLRVPVARRALLARFPFEQTVQWIDTVLTVNDSQKERVPIHPIEAYGLPEFTPATITELGGPGLRIETSLDVKMGERLLVVFDLEIEPLVSDDPMYVDRRARLIEDIGEVRHVKQLSGGGASIAVELFGLKDADVNELIRATNAALIDVNEKENTANENHSQEMTQEVAV